jgi:hypothetical protein|tara:strand:+ start:806 stop:1099 length:294 start_codon:yes stop_codon:yes gene_type:complete
MTVLIEKPSFRLRDELTALKDQPRYYQQQFWFSGDGTETDFAMPAGWEPLHVFDAGALQKEGSGDEYEVVYDGFIYTVSFNTAPTNGNDIGVIGVKA